MNVGDLVGPAGTIPATAIDSGYVSYRISRVTGEGTVYTIAPRLIMPGGDVEMPQGLTRRFWMTVRTPADARPGALQGHDHDPTARRANARDPARVSRPRGPLYPVDIPAGPFGYTIGDSVVWG